MVVWRASRQTQWHIAVCHIGENAVFWHPHLRCTDVPVTASSRRCVRHLGALACRHREHLKGPRRQADAAELVHRAANGDYRRAAARLQNPHVLATNFGNLRQQRVASE